MWIGGRSLAASGVQPARETGRLRLLSVSRHSTVDTRRDTRVSSLDLDRYLDKHVQSPCPPRPPAGRGAGSRVASGHDSQTSDHCGRERFEPFFFDIDATRELLLSHTPARTHRGHTHTSRRDSRRARALSLSRRFRHSAGFFYQDFTRLRPYG